MAACTSPPAAPTYPWFPFSWYGQQLGRHTIAKVAMLVPVRVGTLRESARLVAQFDLGSNATMLYENALRNYFPSRRQLYAAVDTTRPGAFDTGVRSYPTSLPLAFGPNRVPHPVLAAQSGDEVPKDSLWTKSDKLVGTIGSDFLAGRVLVIDYPRQRMCVLDSVDAYWRARTTFVTGRVVHHRLQIPLTVRHHTYWAVFDTGASLFPLSTDEATWRTLAGPGAVPTDTLPVSSWGKEVPFYGAPLRDTVYLGALALPPARAWFTRDARHLAFAKAEHLDASTGNAFFTEKTVILDFKHSRLGVVRQPGR